MTEKGHFMFSYSHTDDALLQNLGRQLKQMRLNRNLTQGELSEASGLSRSTISEMENKGAGSMSSFIRILRVLEKLEILNHFISEAPISPIQLAKLKGKTRKRASGTKIKPQKEEPEW